MTTMYTPGEVRKLKRQKDELLKAANDMMSAIYLSHKPEFGKNVVDASSKLAEAIEKATK